MNMKICQSINAFYPLSARGEVSLCGAPLFQNGSSAPHQQRETIQRRDQGQSIREIAQGYNINPSTIPDSRRERCGPRFGVRLSEVAV
jgi:hypothetical protein